MAQSEPFFAPLSDEVLLHGPGKLKFTSDICVGAGGPSQTVEGEVWLTHDWLAFRPGWPDCFEPLWLWLSEEEDAQSRRRGIVTAPQAERVID